MFDVPTSREEGYALQSQRSCYGGRDLALMRSSAG